jgi:hypothetical protein
VSVRSRRARLLLVAAVAVLVVGSSTAVLAQTSGGAGLGGFKLDSRAQAINIVHDSPSSPSPTHPDFDGSVPAAQSTTDTGPIGHGLAAIFWPGPLGGNFGAALNQINQVCAPPLPVPGVPPVCAPIPQQLKDHSSQFNDPVRAETFYPQAPQDSDYKNIPGVTMNSHVTDGGKTVKSFGSLDGFGAAGVGIISNLTATTTNTLTDTTATAEATSEAKNVVLANGLVTIARVFSWAKLHTDGTAATIDQATTTVDGLKIAGQAATVDQDGVHIAGQSNPAHNQINAALAMALAKSGLTIKLVSTDKSTSGATGSVTAGSLVIQYEDDKEQLVPGGIQNSFAVALGGATANVDASQGSNSDLGEPPADVAGTDNGGGTSATVGGLEIPPAGLGDVATPLSSIAPRTRTGAAASLPFTPILNTFGLAWGLVLFAVLAALGVALGLRRLTDDVFAAAPATAACPLEEPTHE